MTHPTRRGTRTALLAAVLTALAACGGGGDANDEPPAGPLPPGTRPLAAAARLQAPARSANCYSGPVRIVFHTQEEWNTYWVDVQRGCAAPPLPPGFDFSRDMLVYAAMGKRMSPRDRISIDGSGVRNDTVIIALRRVMMTEGCPGPRQPTFPQSLVKLPADNRPLRFSEEHRRIPCDLDEKS
ncbi:MAG TPA: hypothetical protein VF541_16695 [Longimicrobium sp.]